MQAEIVNAVRWLRYLNKSVLMNIRTDNVSIGFNLESKLYFDQSLAFVNLILMI